MGGQEVQPSPLLLRVVRRNCSHLGNDVVADQTGECQCAGDLQTAAVDGGIQCGRPLNLTFLLAGAAGMCLICVLLGVVCYAYLRRRLQPDGVWRISAAELVWPEPPVCLGRGSFGQVLKANYRGLDVAVKRVLPMELQVVCTAAGVGTRLGNGEGKGSAMQRGQARQW